MSKTIISPVKRWQGEVILSDPLMFPQVFAFEEAIDKVKELGNKVRSSRNNHAWLPGIFACVEEWKLESFPASISVDTFPATPRASREQLIAWLVDEITKLYLEADEIPNA